jgi:hypothetical protein
MQGQYYQDIKCRRSSKRWTAALITKLWDVAWDLWDFWNAVSDHQQNLSLQEDTSALDVKVRDLCTTLALTGLLPKDKRLTPISITRFFLFPRLQKVEWIEQVTLALAQAKKTNFQIRLLCKENTWHRQRMILSMQLRLQNWLLSIP